MTILSTNYIRTMNWEILLFLKFTQQTILMVYIELLCLKEKHKKCLGSCLKGF